MPERLRGAVIVLLSPALLCAVLACGQPTGEWKLSVSLRGGEGTKASPLPCRVHLTGPDGKPVRPPALPFFHDHFVCDGVVSLALPAGAYSYTIEGGPEVTRAKGAFEVAPGRATTTEAVLERIRDLGAEGWYSGDLHIHRDPGETALHVRAEALSIAPLLTVWNQNNRWASRPLPDRLLVELSPGAFTHVLGCEDERQGGALLYLGLSKALDLRGDGPELPPSSKHLMEAASEPGAWIDIEKPFWWDVPVWIASGKARSIGIANNHMCRSRMYENEAWGRPRDEKRLPAPRGNGFYTQELYYRILNCGIRLPPSAGSASGVLPNPVGYNRVYVHVEGQLRWDAWWGGLGAGRSFVTNGPLLLVRADGKLPGEVFRFEAGAAATVSLEAHLWGADPIEAVEVIRDGEVVERLEGESAKPDAAGRVPLKPVRFERSGWLLVRAIAQVPETFRFASTAPFYVEVAGDRSTVHRKDVDFFLDWIDERIRRLEASPHLKSDEDRKTAVEPQRAARRFFEGLRERSR